MNELLIGFMFGVAWTGATIYGGYCTYKINKICGWYQNG